MALSADPYLAGTHQSGHTVSTPSEPVLVGSSYANWLIDGHPPLHWDQRGPRWCVDVDFITCKKAIPFLKFVLNFATSRRKTQLAASVSLTLPYYLLIFSGAELGPESAGQAAGNSTAFVRFLSLQQVLPALHDCHDSRFSILNISELIKRKTVSSSSMGSMWIQRVVSGVGSVMLLLVMAENHSHGEKNS